jgi:REP element-mobilizing transposase RayT
VSLRVAAHVWNLRSERSYAVVHGALDAVRGRPGFRVVHFSIQANHVHLIVEADGPRSLATGMRALSIRLARRLNVMMGTGGPVFEDRFHAHVLRTPTEVRHALRYVAENHANHRERLGLGARRDRPDSYSSAVARVPLGGQLGLWDQGVASAGRTWLLREGERVNKLLPRPDRRLGRATGVPAAAPAACLESALSNLPRSGGKQPAAALLPKVSAGSPHVTGWLDILHPGNRASEGQCLPGR